jgi:predicted PurR-regulated permease PerM
MFIVALAAFIALILRAVWGKGLSTLNRFSDCLEKLTNLLNQMDANITEMRADQRNSLDKFQNLSLDALKGVSAAKFSKPLKNKE